MSSLNGLGNLSRLPLEIREMIYKLVIFPLRGRPFELQKWWRSDPKTLPCMPSALTLSKQIEDEAANVVLPHAYLTLYTHDVRASDTYFTDPNTLAMRSRIMNLDLETTTELRYNNAGQWSFDKIYPEQETKHLSMYKIQHIRAAFPNLKMLSLRIWIRFHIEHDSGSSRPLINGVGALELLADVLRPVLEDVQHVWISLGTGGAYLPPDTTRVMVLCEYGMELMLYGQIEESEQTGLVYHHAMHLLDALRQWILRDPAYSIREDQIEVVRPDSEILRDIRGLSF